ncbi:uncharacterized protein LOC118648076 isoform X1 [Monomorium pharaonis]|uniref:uncharacterized protein LOC118648076 isoform X1 n=1 Tax=Monomorium pharaonis TaxID=307658 RepID=UPI001745ECC7|nr:uncharacterized protein LOC118648076 isoform X1 [Monomorium pharaonis]
MFSFNYHSNIISDFRMYHCHFCTYTSNSWGDNLQHQQFHKSVSDQFHCGYNNCRKFFKKENNLRMHMIRTHRVSIKTESISSKVRLVNQNAQLICTVLVCKKVFQNYSEFLKHLKEHIRNDVRVNCPYSNCNKAYENVQSFTGHLSKYHRNLCLTYTENDNINNEYENLPVEINALSTDEAPAVSINNNENKDELFLTYIAQFYLKLESQYLVPVSTIDHLAADIENMYNHGWQNILDNVRQCLKQEKISESNINRICKDLTLNDLFLKNNKLLNNKFKRTNYYMHKNTYVAPKKMKLDTDAEGKESFFYYVPILKTIKAMYADKCIEAFLDLPLPSSTDIFQDFIDGKMFKKNEFFAKNPKAIKIILYQDGFEIVNPIGSARTKHKILGVYMSLGNLPDYIRTHINSIQLVALVKEKLFDHNKVYGPIVKDLQILETFGIEITPNNIRKGGLVLIAGDNLGSHVLGGFMENFSFAIYFCRYCIIKHDFFTSKKKCNNSIENTSNKSKSYERKSFELRTEVSYKSAVSTMLINNQNNYGIKFDSVFNQLQSFHVCKPGLPPCLGHDLMEGVVAYDLALIVQELVRKKWFTYERLNCKIEKFFLSPEDSRNKPVKIQPNCDRIVGGAWEIRTLLRFMPLMVYNDVKNSNDPIWHSLLLLTEIMEIVCAPVIHKSFLPYLQVIINEYLDFRTELFMKNLRPKHHYLSHYPYLIDQFGPLIKVWTLRFESKHTYFKRVIRNIKNFINVTQSLSIKHERLQCLLRSGSDMRNLVDVHEPTIFNEELYSDAIRNAIRCANIKFDIFECDKIIFKGTLYKIGNAVVIRQKNYQYGVQIGKICLILTDSEEININIVVERFITTFNPILRFYELMFATENKTYECLNINTLNHVPLHIYTLDTIKGIKLKHVLVNERI